MTSTRPGGDIGYLLNRATRLFRLAFADALADIGLTPQQAAVVMAIDRAAERRLTPRAIAASIGTDQATTSGLLERLTRDGWLTADPNPDDGRSRLIALSRSAEESLPGVLVRADRVASEATQNLSPDEARTLGRLLGKLCCIDEDRTTTRRKAGDR